MRTRYEIIRDAEERAELEMAAAQRALVDYQHKRGLDYFATVVSLPTVALNGPIEARTARRFLDALPASGDVLVTIDSEGGYMGWAQMAYQRLTEHDGHVHVLVVGLAASAASYIACAGDTVAMVASAQMMIHNPWTKANVGNDVVDYFLSTAFADLVLAYSKHSGLRLNKVRALMDAETWMSPAQAIELGFSRFTVTA